VCCAAPSRTLVGMTTLRRRALRPRPLTVTAQKLLRAIRAAQPDVGTPKQAIAASGISPGPAWSALVSLQERGLVRLSNDGQVLLTRAGEEASRRAAA
jgi:Mn-dependent DtxR family transcriptional regulator